MNKRKLWFGLAALAAAWLFDFLFWGKSGGISFAFWTLVLLAVCFLLAWHEGKKPSRWSLLLVVLIVGFSLISAWRSELFTRFSSMLVTLAGFILLVTTFLNGHWIAYRMVDYVTEFSKTIWAGLSGGFKLLFLPNAESNPPAEPGQKSNPPAEPGQKSGLHRTGSILLGLVIALPIVLVLGLMLASADPVFGDVLKKFFSIEHLPEYIFRFFYIVIGAFVLVGLFLHAVLPEKAAEKPDTQQAWMKPFLGWTEGSIVLGAVNLLFIVFVVIQVRYLFGGTANINEMGYTYADYARRGFGELVGVAVISLLLYLTLNTITKREAKGHQVGFSVLSVLLMANVLVILASSLQRLLLYEGAYGFSELRTYTHVFIYWLAALILAVIVLEVLRKRGHFALALVIMIVGFTATLGLMNVDGFVTRQNVQSAQKGSELDVAYLTNLSTDAVPALVSAYLATDQPVDVHNALGAVLACRVAVPRDPAAQHWQSFRFGQSYAEKLLTDNQSAWSRFKAVNDPVAGWQVVVDGKTYSCNFYTGMD